MIKKIGFQLNGSMSRSTFSFFDYLGLKHVGLLEMLFALTPILSGFRLGNLPMSVLIWIFLLVIVILQGKISGFKIYWPLLLLSLYWLLHTILIMFLDDVNTNAFYTQILYFVAVFALYPVLDLKKLKGSLNWVALISIAGLLFQWQDILRGATVHPLGIPGLTMAEYRLTTESVRPSSFFMEPAAYAAFTICPLYFALVEKKYIWVIGLILSMFLTTSTTGIVLSFLMLGVSIISSRGAKKLTRVVGIVIAVGLYFSLITFDAFEFGVGKIESTESTNVRISQGIYVVGTMEPQEYIFGAPFSSADNYCNSGRAPQVVRGESSVFISTIWELILLYGVVGLALYLNIYIQILKKSRITLTLVLALFAVLFTSGYSLGVLFIFTLIMLLVVSKNNTYFSNSSNSKI